MAEGRRLALVAGFAAGKSEDMILTELLPRENPMPKKNRADGYQSEKEGKHLAGAQSDFRVLRSGGCHFYLVFTSSKLLPMDAAQLFAGADAASPSGLANSFCIPEKKSTGTGKTTVVFFSTPISVRVCR